MVDTNCKLKTLLVLLGYVLVALVVAVGLTLAQQDVDQTSCPICNMDVGANVFSSIVGNQRIYGCQMAGHLELLVSQPSKYLGAPVAALPAETVPYTMATTMKCPVCGLPFSELKYAVPWIKKGNQKIFACSEAHAQQIFENPSQFVNASAKSGGFCDAASGGSVMFNGFQFAIGANTKCVLFLFQHWIERSGVKYFLGFLGALVLAVVSEGYGEFRKHVHEKLCKLYGRVVVLNMTKSCSTTVVTPGGLNVHMSRSRRNSTKQRPMVLIRRLPWWCKVLLAVLYIGAMVIAYFVMLLVMTLEAGMLIAVLLGLGMGFFVFKDTESDQMSGNVDPCCSA